MRLIEVFVPGNPRTAVSVNVEHIIELRASGQNYATLVLIGEKTLTADESYETLKARLTGTK